MKMKKHVKIISFLIICLTGFLYSISYGQSNSNKEPKIEQVPIQNTMTTQQMSQAAQQSRQEAAAPIEKTIKEGQSTKQQLQLQVEQTQKLATEGEDQQDKSSQQCDCYSSNDPNNADSSNFYYDSQGNRMKRVTPPCICLPKQQTQTNTPSYFDTTLQKQNNNSTGSNKQQSGSWGIQY